MKEVCYHCQQLKDVIFYFERKGDAHESVLKFCYPCGAAIFAKLWKREVPLE